MAFDLSVLRRYLIARRHTALLVAIVTAFAARPLIGDRGAAPTMFSVVVLTLMLVALYAIQIDELVGDREALLAQGRRRSIVGWTLAIVATAGRLSALFVPIPRLYVIEAISWGVFFSFVTWVELRGVLKQREVTSETISMSISVYLLLGLTWGFMYIAMFLY